MELTALDLKPAKRCNLGSRGLFPSCSSSQCLLRSLSARSMIACLGLSPLSLPQLHCWRRGGVPMEPESLSRASS